MGKSGKLISAIIIVAIIAGGALLLTRITKNDVDKTNNTATNQTDTKNKDDTNSPAASVTITYDGNTFTLSADSIVAGDSVTVHNDSSKTLDFDSDPHPVHTDNKELNLGDIPAGESRTFALNKVGKWGFHNHLDASQQGELTVREK